MVKKTFGDRLRAYKAENRLSLAKIGEMAGGVSPQAVHKWLGGGEIESAQLAALARATGLSEAWWRYGTIGSLEVPPIKVAPPSPHPPLTESEDRLISLYRSMPEGLKVVFSRIGVVLLEVMGPPSPNNPFGRGKRKTEKLPRVGR